MKEWIYKIYINDELVEEVEEKSTAYLKFESAKLLGMAEIHKVYIGNNFDPILHFTRVEKGGEIPPCDSVPKQCKYRKSIDREFHATTRRTAVRAEVMCPSDRCGYLLKPSKIGGNFFDYANCIRA